MKMFELTDEQMKQAREFENNHKCSIPRDEFGHKILGAIGGGITYSFTPTGLGVVEVVQCACGAKLNLTNFDDW
jgi:hypothetical protein